jgi:hypothetical protein
MLETLSVHQWKRLLEWLDVSGLALLFGDRMAELRRANWLPSEIATGLQRRLHENTARTASMLAESIAIQTSFREAEINYAVLKGISFWPNSVPRPELRSQFDLDYLVAENDIPEACETLLRKGYRLYARCGRSWEFKRNEKPGVTRKEMYRDTGSFRVEIHSQPANCANRSPLETLEWCTIGGFEMPVLSPVELFLGQAKHATKHIVGEFVRASHLLELRRHVLHRYGNDRFWNALMERAEREPRAVMSLGVATALITRTMGVFAPETLTSWTVDSLPSAVKTWVATYGDRIVFAAPPGNKLYLLLQRELNELGSKPLRGIRRSLIPSGLPPPVIRASRHESLAVFVKRQQMQVHLIGSRLRFHIIEGLRLALEAQRWKRLLKNQPQ